jgi:hypothetical protein
VPISSQGDGTVLKMGVIEFPSGRTVLAQQPLSQYEIADNLPGVPVLPETLLKMELQFQGSSVDLRGFSEAVLSDLGATIQVLRLAGHEYGSADDRPVRIEDCISDLGAGACLAAAANATLAGGARSRTSVEFWAHCREIAYFSQLLADEMAGMINPDHAYLAGLLHGIGAIPTILGWKLDDIAGEESLSALMLAERWQFPLFLKDFFYETLTPGHYSRWSKLIAIAHQLAKESGTQCSLDASAVRSFEWIGKTSAVATKH